MSAAVTNNLLYVQMVCEPKNVTHRGFQTTFYVFRWCLIKKTSFTEGSKQPFICLVVTAFFHQFTPFLSCIADRLISPPGQLVEMISKLLPKSVH